VITLSVRQRQILELIADGFSRPEIAVLLLISEDTVRSHMAVLFEKLGVRTSAHAVAVGFRQGILRADRVAA
jgi:DNA-binding CsgD family transcriptional regulator